MNQYTSQGFEHSALCIVLPVIFVLLILAYGMRAPCRWLFPLQWSNGVRGVIRDGKSSPSSNLRSGFILHTLREGHHICGLY